MPFDALTTGELNNPVDGVKLSLVLVTLTPVIDPEVALVNVGYNAVAVDVSFVTVIPAGSVAAIVIEPEPGVMDIPVPAVSEAFVNVLPVVLPIKS
jgi:hypothetical protein